jgi:hypothetical protein
MKNFVSVNTKLINIKTGNQITIGLDLNLNLPPLSADIFQVID